MMRKELDNLNKVLINLYQNIRKKEEEYLENHFNNLTYNEVHTLEAISNSNEKSITALSKELRITPGTISVCVDKLISKGYVKRINDDLDKRKVLIDITTKSIPVLQYHETFHEKLIEYAIKTLNLDITDLTKSLVNINEFLEEMGDKNE